MAAGGLGRKGFAMPDLNVIALVKGEERYVFLFSDADRSALVNVLGRFAANPGLSFNWKDAGVLAGKAMMMGLENEEKKRGKSGQQDWQKKRSTGLGPA